LLDVVEGRTLDLISTPDGRVIAGEFFPHLLKDFPAIRRYQIIQEQREELIVRLAVDEPFPSDQSDLLRAAITRAVGPQMRINWEIGADIVIEQERKFRPVRSSVPVTFEETAKS